MNFLLIFLFALFWEKTYQIGEWSYLDEQSWSGVCTTGKKQSPINIESNDAILDKYEEYIRGPLVFRGYDGVKVRAINNGHTLKWLVLDDEDSPPVMSGGPLRGNYTLLQFHLHWLSEHSINGYKYPLEIHLVHKKTGISLEEALKRRDGLAVIGLLGQVYGEEDSGYSFDELEPGIPNLLHYTEEHEEFTLEINISRLFSPRMQSFYAYPGSLTTPGCNEVVTWIVMDVPITVSDNQFKLISKVDIGGVSNYRSLQPVNNRPVYRSLASCSSVILPGFLTILPTALVLLRCTVGALSKGIRKALCPILNIKKKILGHEIDECAGTN